MYLTIETMSQLQTAYNIFFQTSYVLDPCVWLTNWSDSFRFAVANINNLFIEREVSCKLLEKLLINKTYLT